MNRVPYGDLFIVALLLIAVHSCGGYYESPKIPEEKPRSFQKNCECKEVPEDSEEYY